MYDNILVPTDGSHGANAALEHGIEIAGLSRLVWK
ncbi:universal stress protein [Halococcus hamelinensis]|nr:universal stress protein [Halococcus hamelinensis]